VSTEILKGTITAFGGSWGSGLGFLAIDGIGIPCDNAPTVRALEGAFGDVIAPNHSVNQAAIIGKEIYYSVDDIGVLDGFTPVDEASEELVEAYENPQVEGEEDQSD
jgi:hypothetical protein